MSPVGITQMNSLLSSQQAMKSISSMNTVRKSMEGSSNVLASEIKIDKDRNVDTKAKEEELAELSEKINNSSEKMGSSISDLNDKIAEDREKIKTEEEIKAKETKAKEETAKESADKDASSSAARSDLPPAYDLDISSEGRAAAEANLSAAVPVISSAIQEPSKGAIVDQFV